MSILTECQLSGTLFPELKRNVQKAQGKQVQMKTGQPVCLFKAGDLVLQCNMLQKTKAGHKFEDRWLGPYKITAINADKGTCNLENSSGKKLKRLDVCEKYQTTLAPEFQHWINAIYLARFWMLFFL